MNLQETIERVLSKIRTIDDDKDATREVLNLAEFIGGRFRLRLIALMPKPGDYAEFGCTNDPEYQEVRRMRIEQMREQVPRIMHEYLQLSDSEKFRQELNDFL
jgi:hypothetical protein